VGGGGKKVPKRISARTFEVHLGLRGGTKPKTLGLWAAHGGSSSFKFKIDLVEELKMSDISSSIAKMLQQQSVAKEALKDLVFFN